MIFITLAIFIAFFNTGSSSLYEKNSPVFQLDSSNFDKLVVKDEGLWLVEFYAPWCGHCKALTPEYLKVAEKLKGLIKIGAVDADQEKDLAQRFSIKGYPTIKIFGKDKSKPVDYTGGRNSNAIMQGLIDYIEKAVSTPKKKVNC